MSEIVKVIKAFRFKSTNYHNDTVNVIVRQTDSDLVVINKRMLFDKSDYNKNKHKCKLLRQYKSYYYIEFEEYFRGDTIILIANNLI